MYKVLLVMTLDFEIRQIKAMDVWNKKTGFEIADVAYDGVKALEKLKNEHFDIVISEINLPLLDGLGLLKEIKNHHISTLFIAISSEVGFQYVRECIIHGAFDYLKKIPERSELLSALERAQNELVLNADSSADSYGSKDDYELDIRNIEDAIIEHNDLAYQIFLMLSEAIYKKDNRNSVDGDIVLRYIYRKIIDDLFERLEWLNLYADKSDYYKIDSYRVHGRIYVEEAYVDKLKKLSEYINSFLPGTKDRNLADVINYAIHNPDGDIRLREIASKLFVNYTYLSNQFSKRVGMGYSRFACHIKMQRAGYLLTHTDRLISEIADSLGYNDYAHFISLFKQVYGMNPKEYRKQDNTDYRYDYAQM